MKIYNLLFLAAISTFYTSNALAEASLAINIKNEIDLKDGTYLAKEEGGQERYALITHSHGSFEGDDIMDALCTDGFLVSKLSSKFSKVKKVLKPTNYVLTKCNESN